MESKECSKGFLNALLSWETPPFYLLCIGRLTFCQQLCRLEWRSTVSASRGLTATIPFPDTPSFTRIRFGQKHRLFPCRAALLARLHNDRFTSDCFCQFVRLGSRAFNVWVSGSAPEMAPSRSIRQITIRGMRGRSAWRRSQQINSVGFARAALAFAIQSGNGY
jgi:hypothetical protein